MEKIVNGNFPQTFISDEDVLWTYNGVTLEVDLFDPEFAEKWQKAFVGLDEVTLSTGGDLTTTKGIAEAAMMFRQFIADIFDQENMIRLLGEKLNARKAMNCAVSLIGFANAQKNASAGVINALPAPLTVGHTHDLSHTHSVTVGDHMNIVTVGDHAPRVTIPPHTHTVPQNREQRRAAAKSNSVQVE